MELISSAATLTFLSKAAPIPWVKRMLLWMMYSNELTPYFERGETIAKAFSFAVLLKKYGGNADDDEVRKRVEKDFDPAVAKRLLNEDIREQIELVAYQWGPEGARDVAAGYLVHASSIDWERGTVEAELYDADISDRDHLFWDAGELLNSELTGADYDVRLSGLCFEREVIEMLLPTFDIGAAGEPKTKSVTRVGRPRIWDWDGATTHLLSIAQTPDGLPTGQGAQAQIERMIADWFMTAAGNAPAPSQVRQHVSKIMRVIEKPESR